MIRQIDIYWQEYVEEFTNASKGKLTEKQMDDALQAEYEIYLKYCESYDNPTKTVPV